MLVGGGYVVGLCAC